MNRDINKTCCKERLQQLHEEFINNRIISDIADLAYCNGYNNVLEAAETVLNREDYFKIVSQLEKVESNHDSFTAISPNKKAVNNRKTIDLCNLFYKYDGFVFKEKVAELCGFHPDKMQYIVIDDGMRTDDDGEWVVHHYQITNPNFNPFTEYKHPAEEDGYKISMQRIKLSK